MTHLDLATLRPGVGAYYGRPALARSIRAGQGRAAVIRTGSLGC